MIIVGVRGTLLKKVISGSLYGIESEAIADKRLVRPYIYCKGGLGLNLAGRQRGIGTTRGNRIG